MARRRARAHGARSGSAPKQDGEKHGCLSETGLSNPSSMCRCYPKGCSKLILQVVSHRWSSSAAIFDGAGPHTAPHHLGYRRSHSRSMSSWALCERHALGSADYSQLTEIRERAGGTDRPVYEDLKRAFRKYFFGKKRRKYF